MTPEQSRELKPGARVYFNGDRADLGTVTATNAKYVTLTATKVFQATVK